ncbi:MAG: Rieske (2Fe-2S) protein [Gammaproteobacteria bacterium]
MSGFICSRKELEASDYLLRNIEYKKRRTSAVVFFFAGEAYAYINHCMHMQRPLDCMQDAIFDADRKLLRCSMHGFVFEPTTGECLSPVCEGQKLKALKLAERDGRLYFSDKHVTLVD